MSPIRLGALAAATALTPLAATQAKVQVSPYIEASQVLEADLTGDDDVLTYTQVAAGVDASISRRLVDASISYRYEHRFAETGDYGDDDVHTGLARGRVTVVPNLINLEAAGIATRARSDIRGAAPVFDTLGNDGNLTQIYGGYIGPDLATRAGPLAITAGYRFGYIKVKSKDDLGLADDQVRLDQYDSSHSHTAYATVGMDTKNGYVPFGWSISGGYEREQVSQLKQRYEGKYVRGEVDVPVSPTVALTAGVGYEAIKSSQRTPLIGPDGFPVLDKDGRYQIDPAGPRLIAYDTDGLIYDGGVIWKPNQRTTLQVRAGKRYGEFALTGSLDYRIDQNSGVQVGVYNAVDSFGRSLTRNLAGLPTQFDVPRSGLTNRVGGCVFGSGTQIGQAGCFNDSFQSISTSQFRSRGIFATYGAQRGRVRLGVGGGYAERRYLSPVAFPNGFTLDHVKDRSVSAQANLGIALSPRDQFEAAVFADYYWSGIAASPDVLSGGTTASLYHNFTDRLVGNVTGGVYGYDQDGFDTDVSGQLLVGARYQF